MTEAALFLTEADVEQLIDMPSTLTVVENAFRHLAEDGQAHNVPRSRAKAPGFLLHSMSATATYLGYAGWKNYTATKHGVRFHVGLYEIETGRLVALIEANQLGRLRTGAASGVATKSLARDDAKTLGVIGTGYQAATQVSAVLAVRAIERISVFSRSEERRRAFARQIAATHNVDASPVDSPEDAVRGHDVVTCITSSKTPVFDGRMLNPGTHVNAAGGNFLFKQEIDAETITRASCVVVDSVEQSQIEAGELVDAVDKQHLQWSEIHELGDILSERRPARTGDDEITLFKSVGLAIQDVAMAAEILERARARRVGIDLPF